VTEARIAEGRTALYRYYDAADSLLYIGISDDPDRRRDEHAVTAADTWYPLAVSRRVGWFDTRAEAEGAEKLAIKQEKPRFNSRFNQRRDAVLQLKDGARDDRRQRQGIGRKTNHTAAIVEHFRDRIDSGEMPPGTRLPTRQAIAEQFGIGNTAVSRAYVELVRDGFVEERRAHGYFVLPVESRTLAIRVGRPVEVAAQLREAMTAEQIRELIKALSA
jgi:DNA-binding transcriptional regulator YhcF (GntR family)/predicted GIY-YIG superfamily endonuclease